MRTGDSVMRCDACEKALHGGDDAAVFHHAETERTFQVIFREVSN
jgi:hypothetical protein